MYTNPADHLLDVITPSKSDLTSSEDQHIIDTAITAVQEPIKIDLNMGAIKRIAQMTDLPKNPAWYTQVQILLRRNFQEHRRESRVILTSIIQTILIAVLIGTAFLQIGNTQKKYSPSSTSSLLLCDQSRYIWCIDSHQFISHGTCSDTT